MIYTYDELLAMPTLHSGHFANLKVGTGEIRIWVSRMTIEDGELDPVQVERFEDGRWVDRTRGPGAVYLVQGQGCRAGVPTRDGHMIRVDRDGTQRIERER